MLLPHRRFVRRVLLSLMCFAIWTTAASLSAQSAIPVKWMYSPVTQVNAAAYSPDGSKLAVVGIDAVQIYSISSNSLLACVPTGANLSVSSVAFSPDGKTLAIGGLGTFGWSRPTSAYTGFLKIWNVVNGTEVSSFPTTANGPAGVAALVFSPDGKSYMVEGGFTDVAFSPDGTSVAVCGYSLNEYGMPLPLFALWRISASGAPTDTLPIPKGCSQTFNSAFLKDGSELFVATDLGVGVLQTSSGSSIANLDTGIFNSYRNMISVSSDGSQLGLVANDSLVAVLPNPISSGGAYLSSFAVAPNPVAGGKTATGTITLTGPAPSGGLMVSLTSSSALATVPRSVLIPAGTKTFTFTVATSAVAQLYSIDITASSLGASFVANLVISPPTILSLTVSPSSVAGGASAIGTVVLNTPALKGGMTVTLKSSSASATVPGSLKIEAGKTSATFLVKTTAVATQTNAMITGLLGGVTQSTQLTISPPSVKSISLSPSTVNGGGQATATIILSSAAPRGGFQVALSSSSASATVPSSVTVLAGATRTSFQVKTVKPKSATSAVISATAGGVTKAATLTIK